MKKLYFVSLFFTFATINLSATPSLLAKIYGCLLGNQDVPQKDREIIDPALRDFGIQPEDVAVKKMNSVGPLLAGNLDISSFTAFGMWFDEQALKGLKDNPFEVYHEAAHYALKHHQKLLLIIAASLFGVGGGLAWLNNAIKPMQANIRYGILASAGTVCAALIYGVLLPKCIQKQEKEADILAGKTLIRVGKQDILAKYIELLKLSQQLPDASTFLPNWWHSTVDQVAYLQAIK